MTDTPNYAAEITELHDFFAAWFNGHIANNDETFARFDDVMYESFTMITPHARAVRSREDIINGVRQGYGTRPEVRIWVEEVRLLHRTAHMLVVSYVEKQQTPDRETARRSTVVFAPAPELPNGLRWLHVHETWVED
jgi:hypothetical protein